MVGKPSVVTKKERDHETTAGITTEFNIRCPHRANKYSFVPLLGLDGDPKCLRLILLFTRMVILYCSEDHHVGTVISYKSQNGYTFVSLLYIFNCFTSQFKK